MTPLYDVKHVYGEAAEDAPSHNELIKVLYCKTFIVRYCKPPYHKSYFR